MRDILRYLGPFLGPHINLHTKAHGDDFDEALTGAGSMDCVYTNLAGNEKGHRKISANLGSSGTALINWHRLWD